MNEIHAYFMVDSKSIFLRILLIAIIITSSIMGIIHYKNTLWYPFIITVAGYFGVYFLHKKRNDTKNDTSKSQNIIPKEVLSVIFGVIAGFAIVTALSEFLRIANDQNILQTSMTLISFFAVSIPFFHASLAILKTETELQKYPKLMFLLFLVLFVNFIIIYLQARNITDVEQFVKFVTILFGFNAVWLIVQGIVIKITQIHANKHQVSESFWKRIKNFWHNTRHVLPHEEWIWIHSLSSTFLFFSYLTYLGQPSDGDISLSIILLFLLIGRTTLDYLIGWSSIYSATIPIDTTKEDHKPIS